MGNTLSLAATSSTPVLQATDLRKRYVGKQGPVEAVRGVSLRVDAGEVLAFLGPNGAGKTTTVKMICGLVLPDGGEIRILGEDPLRGPRALRHVGAVLEGNRNLYWHFTPMENLEYYGMIRGLPRREARRRGAELLDQLGLGDKAREKTQSLSRGMQQKLALAVAFLHRPPLLLLDEPTLGLDVESAIAMRRTVRELARAGQAVLLTTHQLDVAEEVADRVAIIRRGELVAEGPPAELTARFAAGTYTLELAQPADPAVARRLEELGAVLTEPRRVTLRADTQLFWRVMEALRPAEVVAVQRDRATLTETFLQLIKEEGDASGAAAAVR
jgi:ABC-2 type transport system ATP-binding protein